ncbi:hypothetical protein N7G274_000120 [Stereocaulon virgatum]|uniref:Uncharacterized protein n=1 Tax=Stereocaulon virgatum TaxID=373712 RepID=A0ABR4AR79_9LECA
MSLRANDALSFTIAMAQVRPQFGSWTVLTRMLVTCASKPKHWTYQQLQISFGQPQGPIGYQCLQNALLLAFCEAELKVRGVFCTMFGHRRPPSPAMSAPYRPDPTPYGIVH